MASPPVCSTVDSLEVFVNSTKTGGADPRVLGTIVEVQNLLGDDLTSVETALSRCCEEGLLPASAAARHLIENGGKRVRPLTALLAAACFGPVGEEARTVALVAELIHSATLLHDDVTDEGLERRGRPTARLVYGNAVSVLAGDLLLVHALECLQRGAARSLPDLLQTLRRLIDGEVVQLRGRTELDVREATYEHVLHGKTASLFAWAARSGARASGATESDIARLGEFGERIGTAFQLVDDLLDYDSVATGKTSLMDLREGKLTLPLVLTLSERPELLEAVRRIHAGEPDVIAEVAAAVIASRSCSLVRARAQTVTEHAVTLLGPLPDSDAKRLLEEMARQLAARVA